MSRPHGGYVGATVSKHTCGSVAHHAGSQRAGQSFFLAHGSLRVFNI